MKQFWTHLFFTTVVFIVFFAGCSRSDETFLEIRPEPIILPDFREQSAEFVAVFGDIQEYTKNNVLIDYYIQSVDWLYSVFSESNKLKAVIEVGDVTWENRVYQWQLFSHSTQRLSRIVPYYVCTGNHDYDWTASNSIAKRSSSLINDFASFYSTRNSIVAYYAGNSLENYVAKVTVSNEDLYILVLEFGPREEVVDWANSYVQNHSDSRFLLVTHEWLTRSGERISSGSTAEAQFRGYSSYSTPEQVWQRLVYPNDNIWCVLCGHNGFCKLLYSENQAGRNVPQLLFNLQYQDNGGNGLIQIWKFDSEESTISIRIFDTIHNMWYDMEEMVFDIQF